MYMPVPSPPTVRRYAAAAAVSFRHPAVSRHLGQLGQWLAERRSRWPYVWLAALGLVGVARDEWPGKGQVGEECGYPTTGSTPTELSVLWHSRTHIHAQ